MITPVCSLQRFITRYFLQLTLPISLALGTGVCFAQNGAAKDTLTQLLDYSRPGANHVLLGKLAGTWNFQDAKLSFVKGTATRKPVYDGRFYIVEIKGGKLPLPVADGKMKEDFYQGIQTEGYDNGRMKFVTTSINNHIGSDIQLQTGSYDSATHTFTYEWDDELISGMKAHNWRVLTVTDQDHYTEEYFEDQNGTKKKVRQLNYTRVAGN